MSPAGGLISTKGRFQAGEIEGRRFSRICTKATATRASSPNPHRSACSKSLLSHREKLKTGAHFSARCSSGMPDAARIESDHDTGGDPRRGGNTAFRRRIFEAVRPAAFNRTPVVLRRLSGRVASNQATEDQGCVGRGMACFCTERASARARAANSSTPDRSWMFAMRMMRPLRMS